MNIHTELYRLAIGQLVTALVSGDDASYTEASTLIDALTDSAGIAASATGNVDAGTLTFTSLATGATCTITVKR